MQESITTDEEQTNYITGYVKIYRSLKNHWLWKSSRKKTKAEAFIDLVWSANHQKIKEPIGFDLVTINRGQILTSQEKLSKEWFWERSAVRKFLNMLEDDKMIKVEATSKYTMITLCKYDSYQATLPSDISRKSGKSKVAYATNENLDAKKAHLTNRLSNNYDNSSPTKDQQKTNGSTSKEHQETTNNNDNNYNNVNNIEPKGSSADAGADISLRDSYREIKKDKSSICKFINDHCPDFIEPYVGLWNIFAEEKRMPKVISLNKSRKKKFYIRLKEEGFDFMHILRKAGQSNYILTGSWFGFDWIIENDRNYLKVLEGNYDNGKEIKETPIPVKTMQL